MEIAQKVIHCELGEKINIYTLGDVHEGNCNHAENEFKEAVKIIEDDPNGYWIGMGDYIEAITTDDKKRFDPLSIHPKYRIQDLKNLPKKQMNNFHNIVEPIEGKCLALLAGNHEEAFTKHNSFDVYGHLIESFKTSAFKAGQPPAKLGYIGFLKISIIYDKGRSGPNRTVTFALNHGDGGGGFREGYPLNKVHDVFRWTHADVCLMGHLHKLVSDRKPFIGVSQSNQLIRSKRFYGMTGCFLKTYVDGNRNYFEHKGRSESDIGMLKTEITVKRPTLQIRLQEVNLD